MGCPLPRGITWVPRTPVSGGFLRMQGPHACSQREWVAFPISAQEAQHAA